MSTKDLHKPWHKRLNKRALWLCLALVALTVAFWSGSRYPDLNAKAFMGGDSILEDPLSFEVIFVSQESDSVPQKILYTTANWVNTNKKGMLFGILMGSALLSLLQVLRRRSVQGSFANTLVGIFIGAPLGVCVNCAAPIAKGLNDGGARLETTLATMFSSPTLNFVAITMLFSLFPTYLAVARIGMVLLFIVIVIPILCRTVFRQERLITEEAAACPIDLNSMPLEESWPQSIFATIKLYLINLGDLTIKTLPLMLLAGLLGSTAVILMPLDTIADSIGGIVGILGLASLGLFLPVPIAFDIIVSAALLAAGMPVLQVSILLFVLGIYSIYGYFIIANSVSRRVASTLFLVLFVMGIGNGFLADFLHRQDLQTLIQAVENVRGQDYGQESITGIQTSEQKRSGASPSSDSIATKSPATTSLSSSSHMPRSAAQDKPFTKFEGSAFGLHRKNTFSVADFWPPFYNGHGVGGGDYNNDGWIDTVIATEHGIRLFKNIKGTEFEAQNIDIPSIQSLNVFWVAMVDLNNDGWLDLYFSSYRNGLYYLLNQEGEFNEEHFYQVPSDGQVLTYSASFGDIDQDSDLDIALGNWYFGFGKPIPPKDAQNYLHFNQDGHFKAHPLEGPTGETLSTLLSDINQDGYLDLLIGNDFVQPDIFYTGDGTGHFKNIAPSKQVPLSTTTTMSLDTGDINNDLIPDIYAAQITARANRRQAQMQVRFLKDYCTEIQDPEEKSLCQTNVSTRAFFNYGAKHQAGDSQYCDDMADDSEKANCTAMMVMKSAIRAKDQSLCSFMPEGTERTQYVCNNYFEEPVETSKQTYRKNLPSIKNANVLLVGHESAPYTNEARKRRAAITSWSWNAKMADLNNDQWQDIYVVNGTWLRAGSSPSNRFFLNLGGQVFKEQAVKMGLVDHMIVSSYIYIDFDNDGDLDLITNAVNGPLRVFKNNEQQNQSISFSIEDEVGNRFGIGTQITIHYGTDGSLHQIRELKSGGGFLSFDPHRLHFGLGEHKQISRLDIRWSTGEKQTIQGPLLAGQHHVIHREQP